MIEGMVNSTMKKAIFRFAKETNTPYWDNQIMIAHNEETNAPRYKHLQNAPKSDWMGYIQVLGKKFDIMNQEAMVSQFITKTFTKYAKEHECEPKNIFVVVYMNEGDEDDVKLQLYKGSQAIKEITLEALIGISI